MRHLVAVHVVRVLGIYFATNREYTFVVTYAGPVPVFLFYSGRSLGCVARYVVSARHSVVFRMLAVRVAACGYGDECYSFLVSVAGVAGFVIVVDNVYLSSARTAVACARTVVHHAVAEVYVFGLCRIFPFVRIVVVV